MIDDLMDLESQVSEPDTSFTQKFIRGNSNGPSGMGKLDEVGSIVNYSPKQTNYHPRSPVQNMQNTNLAYMQQPAPSDVYPMIKDSAMYTQPPINYGIPVGDKSESPRLYCIDVINHVKDCPVCQKIYNNNEKTIYIIVIVILSFVIALLLKKLFEK